MNLKFIDFWFLYLAHIILKCWSLESEIDKRVFNASRAQRGNFPYVGRLDFHPLENNPKKLLVTRCTVSLLNEETIITAGHCFCWRKALNVNADRYSVTFGSVNENDTAFAQKSNLSRIFIHPSYLAKDQLCQNTTVTNYTIADVAVAKLSSQIDFDEFIKPIKLSPKSFPVNTSIIHVGFGYNSQNVSNILTYGTAFIRLIFQSHYMSCVKYPFFKSLGGEGDSGGPMVVEDRNGEPVLGGVLSCATNVTTFYVASYKIYDWARRYRITHNTQAAGSNSGPSIFSVIREKVLKLSGKYKYEYTVNQC